MQLNLTYKEILEFVKEKYNKDLSIKRVHDKQLCITYQKELFIGSIKADTLLAVNKVSSQSIEMSYSFNNAILGNVFDLAIKFIQDKLPENQIEIDKDNKTIKVYLNKIEKLKQVLEYVEPTDIKFTDNSMVLDLLLRVESIR
jgi:hypothetical protein